eukprot:g5918.t1
MFAPFRCWKAAKTESQELPEYTPTRRTEEVSPVQNEEQSNRVPTCMTIPPEPLGPPETAELRMRTSPKFQNDIDIKDRYSLGKVLGAGGFAVVRLAKDRTSGQKFACKIILLPKGERVSRDQLSRHEVFQEIEIASRANHPNIVSLKEFYISDKKVSLIMEYMEGGMVLDSLLNTKECRYTEDDARGVIKQVLEGLKYLHHRNVAHRDLKLENLLLAQKDDLSQIKIVDFGLSKHTKDKMSSVLGTPQFVSPEMLNRSVKQYGNSVDMWSAGVLLYIFLSGFPPFYDRNEQVLFRKILNGVFTFDDPVWEDISDQAKDLIEKLLVKDVNVRYTAAQALEHCWFNEDAEYTQPLQETRSNLLRLRRAEIMKKANKVILAMDKLQLERTEDNLERMAEQLHMEDIKIPDFILEGSDEDGMED